MVAARGVIGLHPYGVIHARSVTSSDRPPRSAPCW